MLRKITISDALEKCVKKGKGDEQAAATLAFVLEVLQLGSSLETENLYMQLKPMLVVILQDTSASSKARSAVSFIT